MPRFSIQLQNVDRSHCRYIGPTEADEMIRNGSAKRVYAKGNRVKLRLEPKIVASESPESPACFTLSDMHACVGLRGDAARYAARVKLTYFQPTVRVCYAAR